jgi:hypothetical protein
MDFGGSLVISELNLVIERRRIVGTSVRIALALAARPD